MNHKKDLQKIILSIIISVIITIFYVHTSSSCFAGFPVKFWSICTDFVPIPLYIIMKGFAINFLFWFILVIVLLFFLNWTSKNFYLKYFLNPLFLTILSFVFYTKCTGLICISEGYGFPFGYYSSQEFLVNQFFVDLAFWSIANFIFLKIKSLLYNFLSKKYILR